MIIAVAIFPLFSKLRSAMGNRNKLAAAIYTLIALALLITPAVMISNSIIDSSHSIVERHEAGTLKIPPPNDKVKEWPLIGEQAYALWSQASQNLESTLREYKTETKRAGKEILTAAAGTVGGMMASGIVGLFVGATILALGYELFMAWLNKTEVVSSQ